MKKVLRALLFVVLGVLVALSFACATPPSDPPQGPSKLNFQNVTFSGKEVTFDGNEHSILVQGELPVDTVVTYTDNVGTNAGTYNASVTLSHPDYNTKTLTAVLKINKAKFENITFTGKEVTYNGEEHVIEYVGTLPADTTVTYTDNAGTNAGTYNATVKFEKANYETKTLSAVLKINKAKFENVTFSGKEVTYNGEEHVIEYVGTLPADTTVTYTDNVGTNAGTYNATVKFEKANYETKTLSAVLKINKAKFENVTFSGKEVTYNGEEHVIEYVGTLPADTTVTYTDNAGTNAGTYNATVKFEKANYETKTLSAVLKINKANIVGITFEDDSVEYDTFAHSIQIIGNTPAGASIEYTYNGEKVDEVSAVGEYTVVAKITCPNYHDLILTATLKITSTEEQLYSVVNNGVVYFQNNLDENKLYKVSGNNVVKVNNDVPEYMISANDNLYYYSTSLFSKVIKSYEGLTASTLHSEKGQYLACDGENIYYAVNNLLINTEKNGIYKLALDGSSEPVRLTTDKAEYLTYYDGNIYYSNKTNDGYLSKISTSATNGTSSVLFSESVEYIIEDGGALYFNSTAGLLKGSAIRKYTISTDKCIKLTTDAGKYLTKVGSYIYYVNDDLLTGSLFGKNICKISALHSSDNSLPGTTVLSVENDGFSSLASDGNDLYYYRLNDKHFYTYDISANEETDLMENFVPVEEPVVLSGYSQTAVYNGEIYYTNSQDSSSLYKYNPQTKRKTKVLADCVSGVWFNEDKMYYSTFVLTNYAFWSLDMKTQEVVKINSDRVVNVTFVGDDVYYTQVTVALFSNNAICKLNTEDPNSPIVVCNDKNVSIDNFVKIDNTYYYIFNPAAGFQYLYKYTEGDKKSVSLDLKGKAFEIYNNAIYYYDGNTNTLRKCGLDGSGDQALVSNVEITDLYQSGGVLYYNSTKSGNVGLFAYTVATQSNNKITDKLAHGMIEYQSKIYFINTSITYDADYPSHKANGSVSAGSGALYCYDGTEVKKVA